jgi:hypothetical protein
LFSNSGYGVENKVLWSPGSAAIAYPVKEILQDFLPHRGMFNFWVKLEAEKSFAVTNCGIGRIV